MTDTLILLTACIALCIASERASRYGRFGIAAAALAAATPLGVLAVLTH